MSEAWYRQREQSAGALRLRILWRIYLLFGKNALKLAIVPVMACIHPFCGRARAALRSFHAVLSGYAAAHGREVKPFRPFRQLLGFAWSLADKTDACTLAKNPPAMSVRDDADRKAFFDLVESGKGVFLVSSHLGTAEVLPALVSSRAVGARVPLVHAFQALGHDSVFTRFFLERLDRRGIDLRDTAEIGVETAVEIAEAVSRGDLALMAGDRESGGANRARRAFVRPFLGRPCRWPRGVFRFARLVGAPVFAVVCVRTGWNRFSVRFRRLDAASDETLLEGYVGFLEEETLEHPEEWFHFHDFFAKEEV